MKKYLLFLFVSLIGVGVYAQPKLSFLPYNVFNFPTSVNVGGQLTFYAYLKNTGNATFVGNVDLMYRYGHTAPAGVFLSGVTLSNLTPNDSFPFFVTGFPIDGIHFLAGDDIVVIWPKINQVAGYNPDSIELDSIHKPLHVNWATGINEVVAQQKPKAFFDEANNSILILNKKENEKLDCKIYNCNGAVIATTKDVSNSLPLTQPMPDGIYFIEMMNTRVRVVQKIRLF